MQAEPYDVTTEYRIELNKNVTRLKASASYGSMMAQIADNDLGREVRL